MPDEAGNIRSINEKFKIDLAYDKRYIPPLTSPQVKISLNHLDKIHHTQITADKVMSQFHSFVSN